MCSSDLFSRFMLFERGQIRFQVETLEAPVVYGEAFFGMLRVAPRQRRKELLDFAAKFFGASFQRLRSVEHDNHFIAVWSFLHAGHFPHGPLSVGW